MIPDRSNIFGVPIWKSVLSGVVPYHREMAADVDRHIGAGGATKSALAKQTAIDPVRLESAGWKTLEESMNKLLASVIRENFTRWRYGQLHIRRWAVQLGRLTIDEKQRLPGEFVHNHLPALISAIYYLQVPEDLSRDEGGTLFFNPLANLMDLFGDREHYEEAAEGKLLLFPAYLDHVPAPGQWDATNRTRITVSADVFFVSGEGLEEPTERETLGPDRQASSSPTSTTS